MLSILDYGCPIYALASGTALQTLNPIHLNIRLCTGAFKSSPVTSLLAECGDLPLSHWHMAIQLQASDSLAQS